MIELKEDSEWPTPVNAMSMMTYLTEDNAHNLFISGFQRLDNSIKRSALRGRDVTFPFGQRLKILQIETAAISSLFI